MFEKTISFIQELEKKLNLQLYLVGGAVRDLLLGHSVCDYDFTTNELPDVVEKKIILAGFKPYLVGKKFGTIGLKYGKEYIEITTFRNEIYTNNNRKPHVQYHNDIKFDLERRDLTINAMALSSKGDLIDLFGGQEDLKNGIIRSVGDPNIRFDEDALRILRAIRFAGTFEFKIEKQTFDSIAKNNWKLLYISKERWVMEMDKILKSSKIDYSLDLLLESGVLSIMLPETSVLNHSLWQQYGLNNYWTGVKSQIKSIDSLDVSAKWAVLLVSALNLFKILDISNQEKFNSTKQSTYEKYIDIINQKFFKDLQIQSALKSGKYLKFSNQRLKEIEEFLLKN